LQNGGWPGRLPNMSTAMTLPLSEMSHAAKLRLMEELWDDLCHSSEGVPSPAWHGEVLAARAERVAKGEAEFREWADVKERLLRKKA
jgi:hypothetical protein